MQIDLLDGKRVHLKLPRSSTRDTTYVLSTERSGSSMFWEVTKDVLRAAGQTFCEPFEELFGQGVSQDRVPLKSKIKVFDRQGHVFGIIRDPTELAKEPWLITRRKIILVRDPRDVLVSLFFSMKGSHRISGGSVAEEIESVKDETKLGLYKFVQSKAAETIFWKYSLLCELAAQNSTVFHYEDVIYDKRRLVTDLAKALGTSIDSVQTRAIARRHDEFPAEADITRNVRQVKPGGWREHLDDKATAAVERLFGKVMLLLGYVPEQVVHAEMPEHGIHYLRRIGDRIQRQHNALHSLAVELNEVRQMR